MIIDHRVFGKTYLATYCTNNYLIFVIAQIITDMDKLYNSLKNRHLTKLPKNMFLTLETSTIFETFNKIILNEIF